MKLVILILSLLYLFCSITPSEARRYKRGYYNASGHHTYTYHNYHHRILRRYRYRDIDQRQYTTRHTKEEQGVGARVTEPEILGPQPAIVYQYAIGNLVGEKLSGSWPWSIPEEACVSTLVISPNN